MYENNKFVAPSSYTPDVRHVKRQSRIYSMRPTYMRAEEIFKKNEPRPSPCQYAIEEKLVKSTRYTAINAGGYSQKDGLAINKNPGPGHYKSPSSIADDQFRRIELNKTFYSTQKSFLSKGTSLQYSPRNCSFALPNSGEPFTHTGAIKGWMGPNKRNSELSISFGNVANRAYRRESTQTDNSPANIREVY